MELDILDLQSQIQRNCDISDANYSGTFSLCGLLLRMRDLFKWDHGLMPWEEPDQESIMAWIEQREDLWLGLAGQDYGVLNVAGLFIQPFDAYQVNELISTRGLLYEAGCVIGLKPSFFLAKLVSSTCMDGLWVHTVEQELARDIFTTPVLRQGDQIVARRHVMASALWDLVLEQRASVAPALNYVLAGYRMDQKKLLLAPKACSEAFLRMANAELEVLVYHEIGEACEDVFPHDLWHQMIEAHKQTLVEVFLRSVKDLLADTHPQGLLSHVIAAQRGSSLALYLAMMRPISKLLFPEMGSVLQNLASGFDWAEVGRIRCVGYRRGRELALRLADVHLAGLAGAMLNPQRSQRRITEEIIRPLGILGLSEDGEHFAAW